MLRTPRLGGVRHKRSGAQTWRGQRDRGRGTSCWTARLTEPAPQLTHQPRLRWPLAHHTPRVVGGK